MPPTGHVYLIGYRATGKSALAPLLAERIGRGSLDLDRQLAKVHRRSIAEIWERWGEPYFRTQETILLSEHSSLEPAVIATGGGVVVDPGNRTLMAQTGVSIWLRARPETIAARLQSDEATASTRPPLDPALAADQELAVMLERRRPLYAELAGLELWTDERDLESLADEAAAWFATVGGMSASEFHRA